MTQDPAAEYVEEFSAVIADGRLELQVELPVSPTAFIAPGSLFTISITSASLQGLEGCAVYEVFSQQKFVLEIHKFYTINIFLHCVSGSYKNKY